MAGLDNYRFSITSCLFDFPAKIENVSIDNSCLAEDRCQPLKTALTDDHLNPTTSDPYSYCKADNASFVGRHLRPCLDCLRSSKEQAYLANC
jgi:hypothetical protein